MAEFRDHQKMIVALEKHGLTTEDSEEFMELISKLRVTDSEITALMHELDCDIPFEGGLSAEERLLLFYSGYAR